MPCYRATKLYCEFCLVDFILNLNFFNCFGEKRLENTVAIIHFSFLSLFCSFSESLKASKCIDQCFCFISKIQEIFYHTHASSFAMGNLCFSFLVNRHCKCKTHKKQMLIAMFIRKHRSHLSGLR